MGQGGTKQPIRKVVPVSEQDTHNEETEEETGEMNIDKLGVSAQESDYPEPKPPDRSKIGNMPEKVQHATDITEGQEGEIFSTRSFLGEEYQVNLVPVGASFQNVVKKRDIRNEDENVPISSITPWSSYPVVKTSARSVSLRDSLLGSSHTNNSSNAMLSGTSQREAMLADRERFEYLKLIAPSTETVSQKGQVRKFTYDLPSRDSRSITTDKFRNVEDRLADEIAEKHRDHRAETYSSLVKDITDGVNSERLKVKIILAWMSKQSIGRLQFEPKPPSPDTPNGYMMLIQEGQGTFPVFFALLCREAKLKCTIISGISKGSHYEVGSKDTENLKNTWNAVYVEGSWQLVHPLWVCKGVANRQLSGWMKIEEEGKAQKKLSVASIGKDVPSFNPYFIFTKPEEFIYRNFPDEERWQLLSTPLTLDEFLKLTYIRPIFFQNSFKLQSEDSCFHESGSGDPCEIKISFPKQRAFDAVFGYELSMKIDEEAKDDVLSMNVDNMSVEEAHIDGLSNTETRETVDYLKDSDRYVMVKKSEGSVTFQVRFFFRGSYKLRLYGGYFKEFANKPPWIIDVLMTCRNVIPQVLPLPFDPGPVCWGPGPISENFGLYVPSHVESEVNVTDEEDTVVYFILHDKLNVKVALHHITTSSNDLQEFVETGIVQIGDIITLQIKIRYPGIGEFGLKIDVTSQQMDVNACNYIIHTSKKRPFESYYPRRARRMILYSMETCDLEFLKGALDECERTGLPDSDPDVIGARNRYEFLSCKTELYVALLVNRIDVSEHALHRTRTANFDILLAKEMAKVEEHLQKLLKLDEGGWTCDIPEIDRQSLVELSQLRKPKLEVRLVITAMYMLLGIDEENLKEWGKVRMFLRNQQSTLIEIARLEKYLMLGTTSDVTVDDTVLERVQEILMNYTQEDIRRVDNTAAAYFHWVISVTEKLKENLRKLERARSVKASASRSMTSVQQNNTNISRSLLMSSKAMSLTSKNRTMLTRASAKYKTDRHEMLAGKSQNSFGNKSVMSLRKSADLETISEEMHTLPNNKLRDQVSRDKVSRKSSTIKEDSKSVKSNTPSSIVSFKKLGSNSGKVSANKSLLSLAQETVSGRFTNTPKSPGAKSRVSTGLEAVSNGGADGQKSIKGKALVLPGPEVVDKPSGTFVRNSSENSRQKSISKPVSRKASNATHVSVKSLSKSPKRNSTSEDHVEKQQKKKSPNAVENGVDHMYSFRNEEISGKTFFSATGRSQKGATSRPVSINSNVSRRYNVSK